MEAVMSGLSRITDENSEDYDKEYTEDIPC